MRYICFVPLIGGMAIANEQATGEKPVCILSYPPFAKNEKNIKDRWKDVPYYVLDPEINELDADADFSDIDFVSSVCPCAGMSMLNTANRSADAYQNDWLYKTAEFTLGTIKPKVYWGENAPGLYSEDNAQVLERLIECGKRWGYSFTIYKTDTFLHGIPQHRIRTFFFFWKGDSAGVIPWHAHPSEKPFKEWILDKNIGTMQFPYLKRTPTEYSTETRWMLEVLCGGDYMKLQKLFEDIKKERSIDTAAFYIAYKNLWDPYYEWLQKQKDIDTPVTPTGKMTPRKYYEYHKMKYEQGKGWFKRGPRFYSDATDAVINTSMMFMMHPTECRFLTYREIMALMGLPSDFELTTEYLYHVTQNVPVKTARNMTEAVIDFVNGNLPVSSCSVLKQNNLCQKQLMLD